MNSVSTQFGEKTLVLETSKIARQADGSVMVRFGNTVVLCTVCAAKEKSQNLSFFPLSVHYQEKAFACGKIPGGYIKRESKPSEKETLASRLIDRAIRPLFDTNFKHEVQVICTVLSYEKDFDPEIASIIGASAAINISGIPFNGIVAAARIGLKNNEFLLNKPTDDLDLIVASSKDGVLMIESAANEVTEETILKAVEFAHKEIQPIIGLIDELKKIVAKEICYEVDVLPESFKSLERKVKLFANKKIEEAFSLDSKRERANAISLIKESVKEKFKDEPLANQAFGMLKDSIIRKKALKKSRIDGRKPTDIREISSEVDFLPAVHGSALFTRGETQVIAVTTLGSKNSIQMSDTLDGELAEDFMLHYNFLPFAVGECGKLSAPGRREIGHGRLAWKAIKPLIPDNCPYTIRVVAEVTESNGSSSMASVCSTSLSLMDAGIQIKRPVVGIAMGLIKEKDKIVILSDILGDEDRIGDMDFKIAGTTEGITALQMDLKIDHVELDTLKAVLKQAKDGRAHILSKMLASLAYPRKNVKPHAPKFIQIKINKEKIRDLIGPGGKTIKELSEKTKTKIEIDESGLISVFGSNETLLDKAISVISEIGLEVEIGQIFDGTVVKNADFGSFIRIIGKKEGLIHANDLTNDHGERINIKEGEKLKVKVANVDSRGKINLVIV